MNTTLLTDLREGRNDWQNIQEVIRSTFISIIKMVDQSLERMDSVQKKNDLLETKNRTV